MTSHIYYIILFIIRTKHRGHYASKEIWMLPNPPMMFRNVLKYNVVWFLIVLACYDPLPYKDAFVDTVGGIFIGNVREYACNDGLQHFGDMKITCGPDGLWSKRNFECKSKHTCVGPNRYHWSLIIDINIKAQIWASALFILFIYICV